MLRMTAIGFAHTLDELAPLLTHTELRFRALRTCQSLWGYLRSICHDPTETRQRGNTGLRATDVRCHHGRARSPRGRCDSLAGAVDTAAEHSLDPGPTALRRSARGAMGYVNR